MNFSELLTKVVTTSLDDMILSEYLFFDIETMPQDFDELSDELQVSWENTVQKKYSADLVNNTSKEIYEQQASLLPEFNKIVCIGIGRFIDGQMETSALTLNKENNSERKIIQKFFTLLNNQKSLKLVGFNINGFDTPLLFKKAIKFNLQIPVQINQWKVKPWERQSVDIYEIWRCNTYNMSANLQLVSSYLDCGDPKKNCVGTDVKNLYRNGEFNKIAEYCTGDVESTMCIFKRLFDLNAI